MGERNKQIRALRPIIEQIDYEMESKKIEQFQNQVLRPILKYQNEVFLILFKNYTEKYKLSFSDLVQKEKEYCIKKAVGQNQLFKNMMIGVVIAMFTDDELQVYCQNRSEINRRISGMLIQRLQDQSSLI
ncbi:MAG: glyoxalase [Flavobacteriales bacterium]